MNFRLFFLLFFLGSALFSCKTEVTYSPPSYSSQKSVISDSAMVVAAHPLATEVGLEILRQGGNAIDAIVGTQFALAVVFPRAGNIGGGGFLVYRDTTGKVDALDYREKAPAAAGRDMYLDENGDIIKGLSTRGQLAAGVPGSVDGLLQMLERYGSMELSEVIQPAIELADKGFPISDTEANRLNRYNEDFLEFNNDNTDSPFARDTFFVGQPLVQKNLARTLERIRDQGRAGFYEGQTAQYIVEEMQRGNGIISLEDLKNYQAKWRTPVVGHYNNYRIISMPPPSSGGVALLQLMEVMEQYPLGEYGFHSPEAVHLMAEAERRVYADRAEYLGDSDFYDVPVEELLDSVYLKERMADFMAESASVSDQTKAGNFQLLKETFETTHTSVVDQYGNAASITTTLNSNYGNKVVVHGAGFFLNNEMDDFSAKPGVPNQFGLVGAEANAIQPGKRMLSSMTPTIVEKDGELFMVLGAPGGSTIITAVFQVLTNVVEFDMPLDQAVAAGRFHHQWLPDMLTIEKGAIPDSTKKALEEKGHAFREVKSMAVIKAIQVLEDGRLHGAADPRNPDDDAEGM